jgi:hypothetical protein
MSDSPPRRPAARARKPGETTANGTTNAPQPTLVPSVSGQLRAFFEPLPDGGPLSPPAPTGAGSWAAPRGSSAGDALAPRIPNDWDGASVASWRACFIEKVG